VSLLFLLLWFAAPRGTASDPQVAIVLRNELLSTAAQNIDTRSHPVSTTILGSAVSGCQTTLTSTTLQPQRGDGCARFLIVSRGTVSSATVSRNQQVTVFGSGNHTFEVVKRVEFDGERLLTWPPYGTIYANETPVAISSYLDRVPIIGPLSNQIARSEVMRRRPQIQDAVAADVARDVLQQVNQSVDQRLSQLSGDLKQLQAQLQNVAPLASLAWSASSTNQELVLAGNPQREASAASIPRAATRLRQDEDFVVVISDSLASQLANHFIPQGLSLPDNALLASITDVGNSALSWNSIRTLRPSADVTPSLFSVAVPGEDTVRFQFEAGKIRAALKGKVIPRFGTPSEWLTTNIALTGQNGNDDHWVLRVTTEDGDTAGETTTTGTFWGNAVNQVTSSVIEQVDGANVSRWIPLQLPKQAADSAQLVRIDCRDGLLRAAFKLATPDENR
jgi:hypothetical protein